MPSVLIITGLSKNVFGAEDVFTVTAEAELKRLNISCNTVCISALENYAVTGIGEKNLIYAPAFFSGSSGEASFISASDDRLCLLLARKIKATRKGITFLNGILPDSPLKCHFPLIVDHVNTGYGFCPYDEAKSTAKIIAETLLG